MKVVNKFGTGDIYTMDEIIKAEGLGTQLLVYCTSTACMSVTSDMMSWASNIDYPKDKIAFVHKNSPLNNNIIIVLGCQVTDLAILNDIKTAEKLHAENPTAKVYMGGCLAYRFDIELPKFINRLIATRKEYQEIVATSRVDVNWEKPFWVLDTKWKAHDDDLADGHLFRNMYPLKIGAGCNRACRYCTIRDTRGESYESDAFLQVSEFLKHKRVVLISDSPTIKQIKDWALIAKRYNKPISIRNVEPNVTCYCEEELISLAGKGLLEIYHCPIQSNDAMVLAAMNRDVDSTFKAIEIMKKLRKLGTKIATNIIIDYYMVNDDGVRVHFDNPTEEYMNSTFDYWSWNPYFDGKWDRSKAEDRHMQYIGPVK